MNGIKNDYILKALTELIATFGVKEPIDTPELVSLIKSKQTKEAIKSIALYLNLPVEVKISYVPKGYRPSAQDGFHSVHLVLIDPDNKKDEGITAQVLIPYNLPFFGSQAMINFPISIRLSENCMEIPETLIAIMAHELSHIVLYSLLHKEKENEFYTDLTAMLLGFADIMKAGRKNIRETSVTTYGYLSDENFIFAFQKIERELDKLRLAKIELLREINQLRKEVYTAKKVLLYFESYLSYLDNNLNRRISMDDSHKINMFHQEGYIYNFKSRINKSESYLEHILKYFENFKSYSERSVKALRLERMQLRSVGDELRKQNDIFQKDLDILTKYVSLFYKLKLTFTLPI